MDQRCSLSISSGAYGRNYVSNHDAMSTLIELIGASLPLKPRGNDYWASCPFHREKTSSFKVGWRHGKERFHCFGCGAKGDAADWVMQTQNVGYVEAKRILGESAKPDPKITADRARARWREMQLARIRDRAPDCLCPEWLIETAPAPEQFLRTKPPRHPAERKMSDDELVRFYDAIWASTVADLHANHRPGVPPLDWLNKYDGLSLADFIK